MAAKDMNTGHAEIPHSRSDQNREHENVQYDRCDSGGLNKMIVEECNQTDSDDSTGITRDLKTCSFLHVRILSQPFLVRSKHLKRRTAIRLCYLDTLFMRRLSQYCDSLSRRHVLPRSKGRRNLEVKP